MAFETPHPTIPELVLTIQSDPNLDLGSEFGSTSSTRAEHKSRPTSTRHVRAQQDEGDGNISSPSSRSPQSSFQTVYDVAAPNPLLKLSPSSSILNTSHILSHVPYYINDSERFPPSASSVPTESKRQNQRDTFPPPITDLPTSISKTAASASYSKNHLVLSFIHKLNILNPTLVLQNSGSVARDHLASERTFLAYVRTSLGLSVAGVSIVQLSAIAEITPGPSGVSSGANSRLKVLAVPLGIVSLLFALVILFFGVYRYFVIQRALIKNMFPSTIWCIMFITFLLGAFLVVLFGALLQEKMGGW